MRPVIGDLSVKGLFDRPAEPLRQFFVRRGNDDAAEAVLFYRHHPFEGIEPPRPRFLVFDKVHHILLVREHILSLHINHSSGKVISYLQAGRADHGSGIRNLYRRVVEISISIPSLVLVYGMTPFAKRYLTAFFSP